jgi:hypothetical protein
MKHGFGACWGLATSCADPELRPRPRLLFPSPAPYGSVAVAPARSQLALGRWHQRSTLAGLARTRAEPVWVWWARAGDGWVSGARPTTFLSVVFQDALQAGLETGLRLGKQGLPYLGAQAQNQLPVPCPLGLP